jgi:MFS family permease
LIHYAATFAITFLLSLYLQYIKGLSPQAAGILLVAQPVCMAGFSPLAGKLSDRVEPWKIASIGMAMTAAGLIVLVFVGEATPLYVIAGILIILGIGFALFSSPNMSAIMGAVSPRVYGTASGTVAPMRLVGQMISMALVTVVFALLIGKTAISPENYSQFLASMHVCLVIFAVLCFAGIVFSLYRGTMRQT